LAQTLVINVARVDGKGRNQRHGGTRFHGHLTVKPKTMVSCDERNGTRSVGKQYNNSKSTK
jgi:hypothetical protein